MSRADSNSVADLGEARCQIFCVTGRVQGVFFRASAQAAARDLGLGGYAKNLPDGSVEVLACGSHDALVHFSAWLQQGPPMAAVAGVETQPRPYQLIDGFTIA